MKVRVKLYARLAEYLPAGATGNEAELDVPEGSTLRRVLMRLGLPETQCERVVVNGVSIAAAERDMREIEDGDHVAVWPPEGD